LRNNSRSSAAKILPGYSVVIKKRAAIIKARDLEATLGLCFMDCSPLEFRVEQVRGSAE